MDPTLVNDYGSSPYTTPLITLTTDTSSNDAQPGSPTGRGMGRYTIVHQADRLEQPNATDFSIHRGILSKSPALLELSYTNSTISLAPLDPATLHRLVHFLYTGHYRTQSRVYGSNTQEYRESLLLYAVAVKFNIDGLAEVTRPKIEECAKSVYPVVAAGIAKDVLALGKNAVSAANGAGDNVGVDVGSDPWLSQHLASVFEKLVDANEIRTERTRRVFADLDPVYWGFVQALAKRVEEAGKGGKKAKKPKSGDEEGEGDEEEEEAEEEEEE